MRNERRDAGETWESVSAMHDRMVLEVRDAIRAEGFAAFSLPGRMEAPPVVVLPAGVFVSPDVWVEIDGVLVAVEVKTKTRLMEFGDVSAFGVDTDLWTEYHELAYLGGVPVIFVIAPSVPDSVNCLDDKDRSMYHPKRASVLLGHIGEVRPGSPRQYLTKGGSEESFVPFRCVANDAPEYPAINGWERRGSIANAAWQKQLRRAADWARSRPEPKPGRKLAPARSMVSLVNPRAMLAAAALNDSEGAER